MAAEHYQKSNFARVANQGNIMEGIAGGGGSGPFLDARSNQDFEHELVQSKSSDSDFEGDAEDEEEPSGGTAGSLQQQIRHNGIGSM